MTINPSAAQVKWLKATLFVLALLPFVRLAVFAVLDRLGANPIEFITRNSGDWTLYFLCLTLAVTPLRKLLKWNWLIRLRRMLGLFMFFYALLHFTTFFWFDHFFDVAEMGADVIKRPFITVGFAAFALALPMALTSNKRAMRALGGQGWQRLHQLIYLIAPLAILHFWWMKAGKHDFAQPLLFGAVIALLLLIRVYWKVAAGHSDAMVQTTTAQKE